MTEPSIRVATEQDLDLILDLIRLSLGEGRVPRTREYLTWKHLANPFGRSYLLVKEAEGAIVGFRAFMRWTWRSRDQPVSAVRAVDTVTHPDWRGRGVFTELTLAMLEQVRSDGVAFVFNTPNHQSRHGYLKMGWQQVGRLMPWVRAIIPARGRRGSETGFSSVADLLEAPELDPLLAAEPTDDERLSTRVDRPYLLWRYAEAPGVPYHAAWESGEGPGAAIVFRRLEHSRRVELRLCDLLCGSDRGSVRAARRLIGETARRAGADFVSLRAVPRSIERRVAIGAGFFPFPRLGIFFVVRPLHPTPVDPTRARNWRASVGALELL